MMNSPQFINLHLEFYLVHPDLVDHLFQRRPYQFKRYFVSTRSFCSATFRISRGSVINIASSDTPDIRVQVWEFAISLIFGPVFYCKRSDQLIGTCPLPSTGRIGCHSTKVDSKKNIKELKVWL